MLEIKYYTVLVMHTFALESTTGAKKGETETLWCPLVEIAAGPECLKLDCHKKPHIEQLVHHLLVRCHFTVPKKLGSAVSYARRAKREASEAQTAVR